jgi:hypothetical protein
MSITPYLAEKKFAPDVTRAMGVAFQAACQSLGFVDAGDARTKLVAAKIIEAAAAGEHDPVKLHEAVMLWAAREPSGLAPH